MGNDEKYSVSPTGEKFPLPSGKAYETEIKRLEALAQEQKDLGREIVVVVGVGFVGAVMAAVVADSTGDDGEPRYFVIGMQRPSPRSYWKIPLLNRGLAPMKSEDPEVDELIARCVNDKKTLTATFTYDALKLAGGPLIFLHRTFFFYRVPYVPDKALSTGHTAR